MSMKEERYFIFDDNDVTGRLLIADVVENSLLINENRMLTEKTFVKNTVKKKVPVYESEKTLPIKKMSDLNEYLGENSFSCSVCQNACVKCKNICITCKSPCQKCLSLNILKNSSTDTDDFDKYLESQSKKLKVQPKVKTVGVDTCDLEGHFDYYKIEKKTIRIQKNVATDCADLHVRNLITKKPYKNTVATDTSDLVLNALATEPNEDSDCEFFWTKKEENKTYKKKSSVVNSAPKNSSHCSNNLGEPLALEEDESLLPSFNEPINNKENCHTDSNLKNINFDSTSSDESDIDLITSCKLSKCRQLAKKHKIILKQMLDEKGLLFKCGICEATFQKKYLGTLHIGSHIENNTFKCLNCNENFKSLALLCSHVQNIHLSGSVEQNVSKNNTNSDMENNNSNVDSIKKQKVNKIYQCALCSSENESLIQFDSYKALYLHKKMKHGIGKTKVDGKEIKLEKKLRIKREFICLICGKQFKSSKALKDHSPVHTGEKNYHCDICNKSYTTSANLKIHKRTHTGARNFVCTVCNKAFHKKDSLKVHFRKHSGERPFQCDLCPMKFDRNYILKNHRYTHFSEKTFICPVCGKTFTTHGGLNNHEKGHKKDPFAKKPRKPAVKPTLDAENAVICDVCGKIYSTRSNLRIHKFVHLGVKPFECTICHQTYAKKDSMLTHMRKHTDERPFACETCGMTFYRNHTLKTHLLRHTGERPHKCKMCGKSFTQSSSLAYHVKNHDRKVEKKKIAASDTTKPKKKRINQGSGKSSINGVKKIRKSFKTNSEFNLEDPKPLYEDKKADEEIPEITLLKDPLPLNLPDKNISKTGHFLLPVPEKEILILDKNLSLELPRNLNASKEIDFMGIEKDGTYNNQYNLSKFNYYIAKSHVFSFPKDTVKPKLEKSEETVENLIISKNGYITKEGTIVTLNRDSNMKDVKEEFLEIRDQRLDLKTETTVPITGEILNAGFISDENGDVIPFGSMTLQGLSADNVMISPVISSESEDRKGFLKNSKLASLDSKITYNLPTSRTVSEKVPLKGCHVINLKETRVPQKIHIEVESSALHIQTPVVEDGTLQELPGFYSSMQQTEI